MREGFMMTNLPKVRCDRNLLQKDPWAKLRVKPGVTVKDEAEL
jgi:hypothetical protein